MLILQYVRSFVFNDWQHVNLFIVAIRGHDQFHAHISAVRGQFLSVLVEVNGNQNKMLVFEELAKHIKWLARVIDAFQYIHPAIPEMC